MDIALLVARLILAAVFLVAGLAKLAGLAGSRKALAGFGLPIWLARPGGTILPLGELVVALVDAEGKIASQLAVGAPAVLTLAGVKSDLANGVRAQL
jgi:uncharacterized membrane protein YphA (DoxX/SURF4 family)